MHLSRLETAVGLAVREVHGFEQQRGWFSVGAKDHIDKHGAGGPLGASQVQTQEDTQGSPLSPASDNALASQETHCLGHG